MREQRLQWVICIAVNFIMLCMLCLLSPTLLHRGLINPTSWNMSRRIAQSLSHSLSRLWTVAAEVCGPDQTSEHLVALLGGPKGSLAGKG